MNKKNVALAVGAVVLLTGGLTACNDDDAKVASENVSKAADNFEVNRRITFINGITDKYLVVVTGACSIEAESKQLEVICKTGKDEYKKLMLGLSDNVTYTVEQGEPVKASAYHYRMTFKPQSILPDVDFRGSTDDGPRNQD
ncbi:site-specific recombination directionality factor RDF [Streptomyces phage Blueeyedbeauty]|uniref:Lipoprotein n=1 Tax=Streptomyces phage Blueeyedbeauty TaxID=2250336 RepID=A0A345L253_9CAUD|nr:site-specific recombination directionality factor RDF [Streptomyces phage Blueeyedbeauty]AXH49355.1 hypothetical protein SEA_BLUEEYEDBEAUTY_248 [Streptomyces phage Blueeyedbeauty]